MGEIKDRGRMAVIRSGAMRVHGLGSGPDQQPRVGKETLLLHKVVSVIGVNKEGGWGGGVFY